MNETVCHLLSYIWWQMCVPDEGQQSRDYNRVIIHPSLLLVGTISCLVNNNCGAERERGTHAWLLVVVVVMA